LHLVKFSSKDIGVDLGTRNILMALKDGEIVLREPSVIAVNKKTSEIVASGNEALEKFEQSPEIIKIIKPLKDGAIADYTATSKLVQDCLEKIKIKYYIGKPRIVVGIPSGVTDVEKRAVISVFMQSGAREVYAVDEPLLAGIGAGLAVLKPEGKLVVDIGGGTTEVAAISMGTILSSSSIKIGGDVIDEAIVEYLKQRRGIGISNSMAEDLKMKLGCANANLTELTQEIQARNIATGNPDDFVISSKDIEKAMEGSINKIIQAISKTLENAPVEVVTDIIKDGIYLAGGGAQIRNLDNYIANYFGIKTYIADNPSEAVITGAKKIIDNFDKYKIIFER